MTGAIVGLVLGSIIGAIATIAGSYFLFWRRRRAAIVRLRRAFRTELSALSYIDTMAENGNYEPLTKTVEPPVVYESNADDIGLLSGEEVEALVGFYTDLYWLRDRQDIEDKKDRVHKVVEKRQRAIDTLSNLE
jgi:hypothetical protein